MTMHKCSSERTLPFALGMMRRNWSLTLLYFLVFFFTMSVPILVILSDISPEWTIARQISRISSDVSGIAVASIFVSSAVAVFSGCAAMRYLTNKKTAGFYHGLPLRREKIYLSCVLNGIVSWLTAYLAATLISLIALGVSGFGAYGIPEILWEGVWYGFVFGLVFYAVTVFAGTLTGSSPIQFLLSCVILVIIPATYLSVYLFADYMLGDYVWVEYYFNEETILRLSPLTRLFLLAGDTRPSLLEIIMLFVTAALFLTAGLFFHKIRKTENSAKPVAFDFVGSVVKYICAFPVTLLAGMFFCAIGDNSIFWLIFGFICGVLLWTMLVNTVVTKSAKQMFRGLKGLGIFSALFAVFVLVFGFNCFGFMTYTPNTEDCNSAEVSIGGELYKLNKDELAEIAYVFDESEMNYRGPIADGVYGRHMRYVLHRGNISYAVYRYISVENYDALLLAVKESEGFERQTFKYIADPKANSDLSLWTIKYGSLDRDTELYGAIDPKTFCDAYYKDLAGGTDIFNTLIIGDVNIYSYSGNRVSCTYPIYATFENTIAYLQKVLDDNGVEARIIGEANLDEMAEKIDKVTVRYYLGETLYKQGPYIYGESAVRIDGEDVIVEPSTYELGYCEAVITDKAQIREILGSVSRMAYRYAGTVSNFMNIEPNYDLTFHYAGGNDNAQFYEGKVPDFVNELIAFELKALAEANP